ncbi:MAG: glycosyltransferase family 4 protein [bacterium]
MKKVCLDLRFIRPFGHSGGERYVRELARGLTEIKDTFDFTFLLTRGVDVNFNNSKVKHIPENLLTLRQHITFNTNRYLNGMDLYHYPHFDAPLYIDGPPLVITIHDLHPINLPNYTSRAKQLYFKMMTSLSIKKAKKVITVSNTTANDILKNWPKAEKKMVVIYNAVPSNYYQRSQNEIEKARAKYKLPERYIFYIGNTKPHKNLARLIRAYSEMTEELQNEYPLVIAGVKSREEIPFITENVILPGFIDEDDLPAIYSGAMLFVFPSYAEGFGLPPLEASACKTPSAVARATSLPEIMGENALYFDPFSINEMRDVILYALNNPSKISELAKKAYSHAKKRTWRDVAKETSWVYRDVLQNT